MEKAGIDEENMLQYVSSQDLKQFGLIPELLGRLPIVTFLNPLDPETLKLILTEPKNALVNQYKNLFEMEDIKLEFTEDAVDYIVQKAMENKLGARGLRSICESIITDAMFELPSEKESSELIITREYAEEKIEKSKFKKLRVA